MLQSAFLNPPPHVAQQKWYSTTGDVDPWSVPSSSSTKLRCAPSATDLKAQQLPSIGSLKSWSTDWEQQLPPQYKNQITGNQYPAPIANEEQSWSSNWGEQQQSSIQKVSKSKKAFVPSTRFTPKDVRNVDIEEELGQQNLYKTELCRSWVETGICRYGTKCQFAHGEQELRPIFRHPKYKTEICKTFHTLGTCPYGTRCRFIHFSNEGNQLVAPSSPSDPTNLSTSEQEVFFAGPIIAPTDIQVSSPIIIEEQPPAEEAPIERSKKKKSKADKKKKKKSGRLPIFRFLASDK